MSLGKENEKLEFKKTTAELKEAIICISAILNKHSSGELYFGIRNDGIPVGLTINEKTMRDISQAVSNHLEPKIYPTISEVNIGDKQCIKVVFAGDDAPYFAYGRAYIRVADEVKVMSPSDLEFFILRKNEKKNPWDSVVSNKTLDIIKTGVLKKYLLRANNNFGIKLDWIL